MTSHKNIIFLFLSSIIIQTSCGDKDNSILNKKNFDKGNWLMVVRNEVEETIFIIDDEKVLKDNPYGILLGPNAECGATTCDGFLELYKDGELIMEQSYLSQADLIETTSIREVYRTGSTEYIYPSDSADYKRLWDSLVKIKNIYPTRFHTQPADKDIILLYKYK
jgi:hypothetical protein